MKKVILTNFDLSSRPKERLERAVDGRYEVKKANEVPPQDWKYVEVLLLDWNRGWFTKEKFEAMPNVKLIQNMSAGVDHIDFDVIPEHVIVCGNVGAYGEPIAEHVFAMVFCLGKKIMVYHDELKRGIFKKRMDSLFLKDKTIGILGTGGIGQAVAKLSKAFGMRTLGLNTSGRPVGNFDSTYKIDKLDEVLAESDILVVALPLTVKTRHLLDSSKFKLMKEDCILVNVARGEIIDEKSLYEHLKSHARFQAALDVWWKYPEHGKKFGQDFPFFDLPNFLGTPHVSGNVPESPEVSLDFAVENILRFMTRNPLQGVMKREDYVGLKKAEG